MCKVKASIPEKFGWKERKIIGIGIRLLSCMRLDVNEHA